MQKAKNKLKMETLEISHIDSLTWKSLILTAGHGNLSYLQPDMEISHIDSQTWKSLILTAGHENLSY